VGELLEVVEYQSRIVYDYPAISEVYLIKKASN